MGTQMGNFPGETVRSKTLTKEPPTIQINSTSLQVGRLPCEHLIYPKASSRAPSSLVSNKSPFHSSALSRAKGLPPVHKASSRAPVHPLLEIHLSSKYPFTFIVFVTEVSPQDLSKAVVKNRAARLTVLAHILLKRSQDKRANKARSRRAHFLKMEELKKLVKEGKIKYIGLSEASPETMKAHAVHPVSAVQMEWSLWTRDIEEQIVPLLQRRTPRFQGDNLEKNKDIYAKTQNLAEKHGCSPAQLALAWVLSQGDGVIPIPGACHSPS
ncbi:hypothetical protein ACLB2K_061164 [Fragaria x ananassa]